MLVLGTIKNVEANELTSYFRRPAFLQKRSANRHKVIIPWQKIRPLLWFWKDFHLRVEVVDIEEAVSKEL